jgi:hypothetical protein
MSKSIENLLVAYKKGYRYVNGDVVSSTGKVLSVHTPSKGRPYKRFTIYNGGPVSIDVHRLSAYQKFGDQMLEDGIEVRHLDGDPLNNEPDNLAIGTASENAHDIPAGVRIKRSSTGGYYGGRANRVFTEQQVHEILKRHDSGESKNSIADDFSVHRRTINNITIGRSYVEYYESYYN